MVLVDTTSLWHNSQFNVLILSGLLKFPYAFRLLKFCWLLSSAVVSSPTLFNLEDFCLGEEIEIKGHLWYAVFNKSRIGFCMWGHWNGRSGILNEMFRLRGKAGVEAEQSLNYLSEIVSNTDKVHVWRRNKKVSLSLWTFYL